MAKTKCTARVRKEVVACIKDGLDIAASCELAGIGRTTFYDWKERGAKGEEPYAQFLKEVTKAEIILERSILKQLKGHGKANWQATVKLLEKRFPKKYADHHINHIVVEQEFEALLDELEGAISQDAFLEIVRHLARQNGVPADETEDSEGI